MAESFASFVSTYYWVIIWAIVCVAALVAEVASDALVAIWFLPGAVIDFFVALFSPLHWGFQLMIFVLLSVISLVVSRIVIRKIQKNKAEYSKTNTDLLIGKKAIVTEDIDNISEKGAVKINGLEWSARSLNQQPIEKDRIVLVQSIEGVKLIVTEWEETK